MRTWMVVIVTVALAACSGPTAPRTASAGQAPVVTPTGPASSSLTISSFDIRMLDAANFVPEMQLTETSGKSLAKVQSIVFTDQADDDYEIRGDCFKSPVIGPGQSADIAAVAFPWCLTAPVYVAVKTLRADVTFKDDEGRVGVTSATLTVGK